MKDAKIVLARNLDGSFLLKHAKKAKIFLGSPPPLIWDLQLLEIWF